MDFRISRFRIVIFLIFVGVFLQACGSKNNAPFHVYRSVLDETSQQMATDVADEPEVRIAAIGLKNQNKK